MRDALRLMKEFCEIYFTKRDAQAAAALLGKEIRWFGVSDRENVRGVKQAEEYMAREIARQPVSYSLCFADEELTPLAEGASVGFMRVTIGMGALKATCRMTCASGTEDGRSKLFTMHVSVSEEEQRVFAAMTFGAAEGTDKQAQLDNLINAIPGGVAMFRLRDGKRELLFHTDGVSALTGRTREEYEALIKDDPSEIIYPDDRRYVREAITKAGESDDTHTASFRAPHKDGGYVWVTVSYRRTRMEDGCPILHAVFSSMSYRSQLYQTLVDEAGSGVVVRDAKTFELLYTNRAACDTLHVPFGNYTGMTCHEFFQQSDLPCDFCNAPNYAPGRYETKQFYIPKLDQYFEARGTIVNWAGREAVVEYLSDVTAEEKSRTMLDDLVRNVSCGLCISRVERDGSIKLQYLNEGYFKICEDGQGELQRLYDIDLLHGIHPDDRQGVKDMLADMVRTLRDQHMTYRFITAEGKIKRVSITIRVVKNPDGTAITYSTFLDMTEQALMARRLTDVIQSVPCGICQYRWDGEKLRPLLVNRRFSEMLGEDAMPYLDSVADFNYTHVHPDDLGGLQQAVFDALNTTHRADYTYRMLNVKTGEYLWIRLRGTSIQDEDGSWLVYATYYDVTQEYQTEQLLRESEQLLEYATEHAGLWYWKYDPKLDRAYFNARAQREFGLPHMMDGFVENWLATDYIHPDYKDVFREAASAIKRGEKQVVFDVMMHMSDKTFHWARMCFTNVADERLKSSIAVCTMVLIDTEKELQVKYELERKKPSLGEKNLVIHALFNLTTSQTLEYVYANGMEVSQDGRTAFTGDWANLGELFINEDDRMRFQQLNDPKTLLSRFARGETEFSLDYRRRMPGGEVIWVRNILHLVRDPASNDVLLFEYCYDVEEEKMQEQMYHSITDASYDYVARVDCHSGHYIVYPKDSLRHTLPATRGADSDWFAKKVADEHIHAEDREMTIRNTLREGMRQNLARRDRYQFNCRVVLDDGTIRYKRITEYYLDRQREIVAITREDITQLIQEEAQKADMLAGALDAANQASRAKSQFLSRMSHELRTPMNAIIGLSALAAGDVHNPDAMEDAIGKIGMSARYLLSLINDILEMSRIESGHMNLNEAPFETKKLLSAVNTIIYEQANLKGVDYDTVINSYIEPTFVGDEVKLQQILVNVLGNAVKFTGQNGKVTLAVEQIKRTSAHATLRFVISDTGVGIDEAFLPHLFDAFSQETATYTSTSVGTGLGLAITKNLVEMMGGQISVKSIKSVGSVFTIELQLGVSEERSLRNSLMLNLSRLNALVVDDDVVVCQSTEKILRDMGVTAEWVDSGPKAVTRVSERHDASDDFDAIFIDWKMPDMDGIETARQIRGVVGPDVTIIIMTAYDWKSIETQAREAGVDLFMEKPLMQETIQSVFERAFGARRDEAESAPKVKYDFTGKRILLAEDHPLNIEVARRLLERVGAEVVIANNGLEALECFTTAEDHHFDAILMDIRMPVMDGLTATRSIRNLKKTGSRDIPIIAMTANAFDEDVELSLSNGLNAHLNKPIEPQVMYATLFRLMQG